MDDEKLVLLTINGIESDEDDDREATPEAIAETAKLDVSTVRGIVARLQRQFLIAEKPYAYWVNAPDPPAHRPRFTLTGIARRQLERAKERPDEDSVPARPFTS